MWYVEEHGVATERLKRGVGVSVAVATAAIVEEHGVATERLKLFFAIQALYPVPLKSMASRLSD